MLVPMDNNKKKTDTGLAHPMIYEMKTNVPAEQCLISQSTESIIGVLSVRVFFGGPTFTVSTSGSVNRSICHGVY